MTEEIKNIFYKYSTHKVVDIPVITLEDFNRMVEDKIVNEYKLRNETIKIKYRELKTTGMRVEECVDKVREQYPYLQFDTIRKIVYGVV